MNIKSETVFRKLSTKAAEIRHLVFVEGDLFEEMTVLKGPITEVEAYFNGSIKSLKEVKRIWRSKPRTYFYCTSNASPDENNGIIDLTEDFTTPRAYPLPNGISDDLAYVIGADLLMLSNLPEKPICSVD